MKKFSITSLCILLCCMPVVTFANPAFTTESFDDFSNTIQAELSKNWNVGIADADDITLRKLLFEQFCATMQSMGETRSTPVYKSTADSLYYNPKHSVFVHIVCDGFSHYADAFKTRSTDTEKTYFLKDSWKSLGIHGDDENKKDCNPSFGMNNCDVSGVFTPIMHNILNDMFDVKQAAIYGGIYIESETVEEKIQKFAELLSVGISLCPNNKCDYPKTANNLKAFFKRGNTLLKKIDILNREYIKEIITTQEMEGEPIDCSYPWNEDAAYNIFICGFGSSTRNSLDTFSLMIHNELFFYRLFMAQYMGWIQAERRILPKGYTSPDRYAGKTADIIATTQQQMLWTQEAVELSTKMIREMYATFPIHIGFLIYYEDLYRLRKELAKVVTPLYTLYDKLRNVQKKD